MIYTIVGCGNIGSWVAFKLAVLSKEKDFDIEKINIIDNDILETKNLPYVYVGENYPYLNEYIKMPKVEVITDMVLNINKFLNIKARYDIYSKDFELEGYSIDCRDVKSSDDNFNMRIRIDSYFGTIELNPKDNKESIVSSSYSFYPSSFYSSVLSDLVVQKMMKKEHKRILYHYDLRNIENYETIEYGSSNNG